MCSRKVPNVALASPKSVFAQTSRICALRRFVTRIKSISEAD